MKLKAFVIVYLCAIFSYFVCSWIKFCSFKAQEKIIKSTWQEKNERMIYCKRRVGPFLYPAFMLVQRQKLSWDQKKFLIQLKITPINRQNMFFIAFPKSNCYVTNQPIILKENLVFLLWRLIHQIIKLTASPPPLFKK